MLDSITPVLLTYNEGPNIERTLTKLDWAKDIVVVDSGSTDETLMILKSYPHVRMFHRAFDTHPMQWRYATEQTSIRTDWILRLDADYQLSDAFIAELGQLDLDGPEAAFSAAFDYAIFSRKLITSLYPPKTILLRQGHYAIHDDGHTEQWLPHGPVGMLKSRVIHDDRKSMRHWAGAQLRYMERERIKISAERHGIRDWLRIRPPLMPIAVFIYCLFWKGLLFNGKAGLLYTLQRTIAEGILALLILENEFERRDAAGDNLRLKEEMSSKGGNNAC